MFLVSSGHLLLVFLLSLQVVLGEVAALAQAIGVVGLVSMDTSICHFRLGSTGAWYTMLVALDVVLDLALDLLVEEVRDALTLRGYHLLKRCWRRLHLQSSSQKCHSFLLRQVLMLLLLLHQQVVDQLVSYGICVLGLLFIL